MAPFTLGADVRRARRSRRPPLRLHFGMVSAMGTHVGATQTKTAPEGPFQVF